MGYYIGQEAKSATRNVAQHLGGLELVLRNRFQFDWFQRRFQPNPGLQANRLQVGYRLHAGCALLAVVRRRIT